MSAPTEVGPAPKAAPRVSRVLPALLLALLLIRLISMAMLPLMDTTEARYGEIARKMVELNDWITPWFFPTHAISHATAKELVAAFEQQHLPGQNLIYLVQRPFSAAFYSHGQAKLLADPALLASSIPPQGAFIAVHITQRNRKLGQFGDFELLAIKPLPAAASSP